MARFVKNDAWLRKFEVDCASSLHSLRKRLAQPVHRPKHVSVRLTLCNTPVQDLLSTFIGEVCLAADDRFGHATVQHLSVGANPEEYADRQAVLFRTDGAYTRRQGLGQHGQHPVGEVHTGASGHRFVVQERVLRHEVAYVRDVDAQQVLTRIADLERNSVVVVPGAHWIDGDAGKAAEVFAPPDLFLVDLLRDGGRSGTDLRWELERQVELANDSGDVGTRVIRMAENFDNPAFWGEVARRPGIDPSDNPLPGLGLFAIVV